MPNQPPLDQPEPRPSRSKTRRSRTLSAQPEIISRTLTMQSRPILANKTVAERRDLIALTAYYIAEKRGFAPGHEHEDWICAEAQVQRLEELEGSGEPQPA